MKIYFTISNANEQYHFGCATETIGCSMDIAESDLPIDVIEFLERRINSRKNGTLNLESMAISFENPR